MTTQVPADIFDTAELEDPGVYNWRVVGPGIDGEKDEYGSDGPTGRKYKALTVFIIAQEKAEYDEDGALIGTEKPNGVSINHNFKYTNPDGSWNKRGLARLKSLYVVNTGAAPRAVEDEDGNPTYDMEIIGQEIDGFTGWNSLVHGQDKDADPPKSFQYLQGNFRKAAPERVKVR